MDSSRQSDVTLPPVDVHSSLAALVSVVCSCFLFDLIVLQDFGSDHDTSGPKMPTLEFRGLPRSDDPSEKSGAAVCRDLGRLFPAACAVRHCRAGLWKFA